MEKVFTDWFFARFIEILKYRIKTIRRVENLRWRKPDRSIQYLYGFLEYKGRKNIISITNNIDQRMATKTLIHELLHSLFYTIKNEENEERYVTQMEKILWQSFSAEQKRILAKHIPPPLK